MSEFIAQAQAVGFNGLEALVGIGLFLFGIKTMGDQLKMLAGSKMKTWIDKYTTNPFKGFLVGVAVSASIQSSTGTTALAISLVRSGLMKLKQAVAIIMGANVGTTVTVILIGLNLSKFAPYFIVVGAFMYMFSKKQRQEYIALLLIGFGSLFYGLGAMTSSLSVLADMPIFTDFTVKLSDNKFAGVGLGIVMTLIMQASSATVGILQSLYDSGSIELRGALPILFGDNVGTTFTAIIASIGGSIAAKRAAAAHVIFNLTGAIIFLIIFPLFYGFIVWGSDALGLSKMMTIAFAHASFNVGTAVILLPLISVIVWLVTKIIPSKADDEDEMPTTIVLDTRIMTQSTAAALGVAYTASSEMAEICHKMIKNTQKFIQTKDDKYAKRVMNYEEVVNGLNLNISEYLVELGAYPVNEQDNQRSTNLFYALKDLERVGDQCMNVVNYFVEIYDAKERLTPPALKEMNDMFDLLVEMSDKLIHLFIEPSLELCAEIATKEDFLDEVETSAKNNYIDRVRNKEKMGHISASVYVDIISDLERIGDHCYNISQRAEKRLSKGIA